MFLEKRYPAWYFQVTLHVFLIAHIIGLGEIQGISLLFNDKESQSDHTLKLKENKFTQTLTQNHKNSIQQRQKYRIKSYIKSSGLEWQNFC